MPGCSAIKCKNRSEDGFALFLITRTRRSDWLKVLGLPESTPLQFRICEVHFQADLFKLDKAGRLTLKPGAAPTLLGSNLQQQLQQVTVSTVTFSPLSEAVWGYSQGTASMKYIGAQAVLWKHVLKDATNNHQSSQARCAVGSVDEVKLMAEEKKLVNQNLSLLKENEKLRKEVKRLAAFK